MKKQTHIKNLNNQSPEKKLYNGIKELMTKYLAENYLRELSEEVKKGMKRKSKQ